MVEALSHFCQFDFVGLHVTFVPVSVGLPEVRILERDIVHPLLCGFTRPALAVAVKYLNVVKIRNHPVVYHVWSRRIRSFKILVRVDH